MAHSLGLEVIAEGVETEEQRQFLLKHGCESLQGFLLSKPSPASAVLDLLRGDASASQATLAEGEPGRGRAR
jgi:EAL domain-containing protein (putative c-di-GMP-specific phosphodiesterase class I)